MPKLNYFCRPSVIRELHEDMTECYMKALREFEIYYSVSWFMRSQRQEFSDIKHCVRVFLLEKYGASHVEIARAESMFFGHSLHHSTVYNSEYQVRQVLPSARPGFLITMKQIVLGNDFDMVFLQSGLQLTQTKQAS